MARAGSPAERARRLLALLPLLHRGARLSLDALAAAVGTAPSRLAEDLTLLSCCGLPPYSPDALVDVTVDGDVVTVWSDPPSLSRPVRLTTEEATALAGALASCGHDPDSPLSRRLLEAAARPADAAEVETLMRDVLRAPSSDVYGVTASALRSGSTLEIEYARTGEEAPSARVVEPYSLANQGGVWYLVAFCHTAGDVRTFRLDRIRTARSGEETFPPPPTAPRAFPDPGTAPRALLRFTGDEPDAREWPGLRVEGRDGEGLTASVPLWGCSWLARKVLASFGEVVVLEPETLEERVLSLGNVLFEDLRKGR